MPWPHRPLFRPVQDHPAGVSGIRIRTMERGRQGRRPAASVGNGRNRPYGGLENWQNAVGDSFCYFPVGMNGPFIVEDAEHISATLIARHGGWISDDTALLALRVVRTG